MKNEKEIADEEICKGNGKRLSFGASYCKECVSAKLAEPESLPEKIIKIGLNDVK